MAQGACTGSTIRFIMRSKVIVLLHLIIFFYMQIDEATLRLDHITVLT